MYIVLVSLTDHNALVICNHGPQARGIGVEMSGALTKEFCHSSAGGNTWGGGGGGVQWFYQRAVPAGWGF